MNPRHFVFTALVCACAFSGSIRGQDQPATSALTNAGIATVDAKTKADADVAKKAADWVASLKLNDPARESGVQSVIAIHLTTIRNWHNEHPYTTVPAG